MIRHKPQPVESEPAPKNYGVLPSFDGQVLERCEVNTPIYPPVSTFDIDSLSELGISPQVAPSVITPSLEEFQSTMNNIDYNSKPLD